MLGWEWSGVRSFTHPPLAAWVKGGVGERLLEEKGYGWTGSFYRSLPSGNLAVLTSLVQPLFPLP